MLVVASDAHRAHVSLEIHNGIMSESHESPERADGIAAALAVAGHEMVVPEAVDLDLVRSVHTTEYVDFLSTAWERWSERETGPAAMSFMWPARGFGDARPDDLIGQLGYHSFAADTTIVPGTWEAITAAAAIATTAADRLLDTRATTYGLCRPPGHHASTDQFGGYCYLNNAGIAAQRLLDRGAQRVAIIDVDYHHGNGTQSIFYDRSDVVFVSIHADPREEFPWFAGHADEVGVGPGEGWNLNVPLPRGADRARWFDALDTAAGYLDRSEVDAIVVSLGVDAYVGDPLGTFELTTDDFTVVAQRIAALDRPTVVIQEGGYAGEALGVNVAAFLAGC
ncbi:histone deacetylase family protein [Ilumatobacter coccineus]|uniref:Putative acetylpolyamine aminohydrolase n=1 Tax=Ilumatobacter coccineus (strain NBRC 103263 / KCTC 29153 / YM16-304) TaxID=1313172 RepID=A0A6C7EHI2_ILUCY|nr:histone deacetylase family protein [Ilumatobacter coccineus]BAN03436.1 putative acetylpolyamine aminohydrolase [Ilumatobacter coccineus YM16-304]